MENLSKENTREGLISVSFEADKQCNEEKLTVTLRLHKWRFLHRSLQIGVYKDEIKAKNKNDILEEN